MKTTAFFAFLVLCLLPENILADVILSLDSITDSIAESFVYDYATSSKNPEVVFRDLYMVPPSANSRIFNHTAEILARGYMLRSTTNTSFAFNPTSQTHLLVFANGSSFSDITNGEMGTYGSTQSAHVMNLKFFLDASVNVDWQYEASGGPGAFGTSDGIDMRLKIRQFSDGTYSSITSTITNQFFGEGMSTQSFALMPGYYDLITQGRVLFNQPNVSNIDGSSQWSYQLSMTAVPEPSSLMMIGVAGLCCTIARYGRRCAAGDVLVQPEIEITVVGLSQVPPYAVNPFPSG